MKKVLSILICVFILISTVACSKTPEEKSYEEQKTVYKDIIAEYTSLLTSKRNDEELPLYDIMDKSQREIAISEAIYGIVNAYKDSQAAENLGYGYKDFDKNGTPELVLMTKNNGIRAIFTISDNQPILLESNYDVGSAFVFATNNRFFMVRKTVKDTIEEATFYTCHVSCDKMVYDSIYGKAYDRDQKETLEFFKITDGNRTPINEDDFNELYREYKKATLPDYSTTSKLLAPRIYFPLKENTANNNLPVADFSSYAAIRETYTKISTCLDGFDSWQWQSGGYDNLFAFPDDRSFEYYTRLLYAAYHSAYDVGYDEIDLNHDGQDELVLMNEDYRIKAIFTQKDGTPILLDAFADETCWLDDKGLIHVDNEQYYELEYNLYEFTGHNDYNLIYSILVAENGNRYLTKDGKTEKITYEESLTLYYDDYCRYSEPFEPYEQTRNVSKLTYTPIQPPKEDSISSATNQTWHKYSNLKKTSDKEFARSNTYVTFENVTDNNMTVSIKYKFTYSYPDPDREDYLLDETTESTLNVIAHRQNDVLVFDENGIKGRIEFGHNYLWLIIDESSDQRFPVGNHCYKRYSPNDIIA